MSSKNKDKKTQNNNLRKVLKFFISDELFEILSLIEDVRSKKDIYNDIFKCYEKFSEQNNHKNGSEIAKLLEAKFGRQEINIYLSEEQSNILEEFAKNKQLNFKDLYYNIVIIFLRDLKGKIPEQTLTEWKKYIELKKQIEAIYSS